MTTKSLFWFTCIRCKRHFRKYVLGRWLRCDNLEHEYCFYDNHLGEIHNNSYLNCADGICRNCQKGIDILVYSE